LYLFFYLHGRLGDLVGSALAPKVAGLRSNPQSCQVKDLIIGIWYFPG